MPRRLFMGLVFSTVLMACRAAPTTDPTKTLLPPIVLTASPAPTATATSLPTAEGVAAAYLSAWQEGDYAAMYNLLAAQSQAAVGATDFEQQFRDNLALISASGLAASVTGVNEGGDDAQAQAHVTYSTRLLGTLETDIVLPLKRNAAGHWGVVYSPALIWPELVDGNKLYMLALVPDRGTIYDRTGAPLATTAEAYAVALVPGEIEDEGTVQQGLGRLLGVPTQNILARYEFAAPDLYLPVAEVGADEVENGRFGYLVNMAGMRWTPYTSRFYYGNGAAAHVTGYTVFIPSDQLAAYQAQGYALDQRIGNAGLELWGEEFLAGRNGWQLTLLDANGNPLRAIASSPSAPAQDIYATVDFALQRAAQFALGDFVAAAVVLNVDTGEVLALASSPTFDPNLFDPANLNFHFADNERLAGGLLNRATQDAYAAGSVFKIITMSAGMTSGLFTPDTVYTCTGTWEELGPSFVLNDWKEGGHGQVTLKEGLSGSCNPYFWHIGYALYNFDATWLSQTARAFGLAQVTGLEQAAEISGLIPDPDWKLQNKGEPWEAIDSLNLAIGQGDVLVTPLQIARLAAAVANGGRLLQPQLVLAVRGPEGEPTYEFKPIEMGKLPLSEAQLAALQEAMHNVTQEPLGTARNRFRGLRIPVAGKTGTAEDPGSFGVQEPDAWFAGYTFADRDDKPDIAIAVWVSNQGQGSDIAAPIFRRIVEAYFGLPLTRYPWEESVGVVAAPEPTPTEGVPGEAETPTPQP